MPVVGDRARLRDGSIVVLTRRSNGSMDWIAEQPSRSPARPAGGPAVSRTAPASSFVDAGVSGTVRPGGGLEPGSLTTRGPAATARIAGPGGTRAPVVTEQRNLNELNSSANAAREAIRTYGNIGPVTRRLRTGPIRGPLLNMVAPPQGGGLAATAGAIIGAPLRWAGLVSDQDVNDVQRLRGAQSQRVQYLQTQQRGVQTEGDRAYYILSEIGPSNTPEVNQERLVQGTALARRAQARAQFSTQWASQRPLNQTDEQGRSVEQAFDEDVVPMLDQQAPSDGAASPPGWSLVR